MKDKTEDSTPTPKSKNGFFISLIFVIVVVITAYYFLYLK